MRGSDYGMLNNLILCHILSSFNVSSIFSDIYVCLISNTGCNSASYTLLERIITFDLTQM